MVLVARLDLGVVEASGGREAVVVQPADGYGNFGRRLGELRVSSLP